MTDSNDSAEIARLRILDAAANRASEGLRVVEDYARFGLDDRYLTGQLKSLRHDLTGALSGISTTHRLAARESLADVGASTKTAAEFHRPDFASIVTASFQRLQQGLRSLEEFAKLTDTQVATQLEAFRYRAYTLERAVDITRESLDRLAGAHLYVLIDGRPNEAEFRKLAAALIQAGTPILQLREKTFDDRTLLSRARTLREITRGTGTLFIMNDRPDLAVLADADGVHVGQEELSVKDARSIIGPRRLIGVSTHNIEQARQAVLDGANYIGVGPTFPGSTKQFEAFPGLDFVRAVGEELKLPTFPIGGITLDHLDAVLTAGATRVCVSAAVCGVPDPGKAVRTFLSRLPSRSD